jgi:hypothetical protein
LSLRHFLVSYQRLTGGPEGIQTADRLFKISF